MSATILTLNGTRIGFNLTKGLHLPDIEQYITVIKMSFAGKYKYQHRHKNTDNYEEYLKLMCEWR